MPTVNTDELNVETWTEVQDAVAKRFLGMSADEFADRFLAGEFDDGLDHPGLMAVLALFPELD